jgi:hypothetical protein
MLGWSHHLFLKHLGDGIGPFSNHLPRVQIMKRSLLSIAFFSLFLLVAGCDTADPAVNDVSEVAEETSFNPLSKGGGNVGLPGRGAVVRLVGTAVGRAPAGTDAEPANSAGCWDLDMFDAASGRKVGTATDCLSEFTNDPGVGETFALTGTTTFNFNNGSFSISGRTTVQPVVEGSINFTHITGALPASDDVNGVVAGTGTGAFTNFSANARLSGAVNLSLLGSGMISFDCLFVIQRL